jgi:membrane fusion protein, multidrug efflux system
MKFLRFLLPVVILGLCALAGWWLLISKPEIKIMETSPVLVRVEGTVLKKSTYPVLVRSQGAVQPRTQSTLMPEVSAKIIEVSPSFRSGAFFEKDEVLLKLDPVDYETAVIVSKAMVAQAEAILIEEKAKAEQALDSWKALGRTGTPGPLVVRQPQLAKAEADVASAQAQVLKAQRDLERTIIRAPYAGQVLEQSVDVGQLVTQGTQLGRIFAVDYVEIRLPLPEREMRFLNLPEAYRDAQIPESAGADILFSALANGKRVAWQGRLVRVEGAMDATTRQVIAVAQVNDPYAKREDGVPPLKIGQFVEAEITGETLKDVYIIPRSAVRAGNEIILISKENRLRRLNVDPLVSGEKEIVISATSPKAPKEGDVLCLTPIPFPADGARVIPTIDGEPESGGMAKDQSAQKKPTVLLQGGAS